ncbi:MAG: hypothetical protein KQJ78_11005 [Deltaproteobacteria bacterium]|nr:hypothetical protein [Deltaproteobacteria bacterium]
MTSEETREAKLELMYRGVDLAGYSLSAQYTDHAHGKLDELTVSLEDRELAWQGPWFPQKSDTVHAAIICRNWFAEGDFWRLECGTFRIEEVTLSGPPDQVEVRCTSAQTLQNARTQKKSKAHENTDLLTIATGVAGQAGLMLDWQGKNRSYERVDQAEESDLQFLRRLSLDSGNSLKVAEEKLIVYQAQDWDQKGPHLELVRGQQWIKAYRFGTTTHDLYRGAVCQYWMPKEKRYIRGEYSAPDAPETGEMLVVNQPVADEGEAQRVAQDCLRKKNRRELTAEVTLVGDPRRRATEVVALAGFGAYSTRYFADTATHSIDSGSGYVTALKLRQTLEY